MRPADSEMRLSLDGLPNDELQVLIEHLGLQDLGRLIRTSRRFAAAPGMDIVRTIWSFGELLEDQITGLSRQGKVRALRYLLRQPGVTDEIVVIGAQIAALHGKLDAMVLLLDAGAPPGSVLPYACEGGRKECAQVLLHRGADANARHSEYGMPSLVIACKWDFHQVALQLIEAGADVNAACGDCTALIIAARRGHDECIRVLLNTGRADMNATLKYGETALAVACLNGRPRTAQILINARADVNKGNPVQRLIHAFDPDEDEQLRFEACLEVLTGAGARVDAPDEDGCTPLLHAALCDTRFSQILLDAGASVDHQNHNGQSALMRACRQGCVSSVRALLMAGASTRLIDNNGNSAWFYAVPIADPRMRCSPDDLQLLMSRSNEMFELMRRCESNRSRRIDRTETSG